MKRSPSRSTVNKKERNSNYLLYGINVLDKDLDVVRETYVKQARISNRRNFFVFDLDAELQREHGEQNEYDSVKWDYKRFMVAMSCIVKSLDEYEQTTELLEKANKVIARLSMKPHRPSFSLSRSHRAKRMLTNRLKASIEINNINDSPCRSTLFIVFIGNITRKLILSLLSCDHPLKYLYEFYVGDEVDESGTDFNESQQAALEEIFSKFDDLRESEITKSLGIFWQSIPAVPASFATEYARRMYDDLVDHIYDEKITNNLYFKYYHAAFRTTNVAMSNDTSLEETCEKLSESIIKGYHMTNSMPLSASDLASVSMYLSFLFDFIDPRPSPETLELEGIKPTSRPDKKSIFRLRMLSNGQEFILVEHCNTLLCELIAYAANEIYDNVKPACLEFNMLKDYVIGQSYKKHHESKLEHKILPRFVKLLGSEASVNQCLNQMMDEFEDYDVEITADTKLYTFKRVLNKVFETDNNMVLPSRLCYRDFSIYKKEEFNEHLKRPPVNQFCTRPLVRIVSTDSLVAHPNSEHASYRIVKLGYDSKRSDSLVSRFKSRRASSKGTTKPSLDSYGLPKDHPLLQGYNLDDVLQAVDIRTRSFYFEEGYVKLYIECWCSESMNRMLHLNINHVDIKILANPENHLTIAPTIDIVTKNKITVHLLAEDKGNPKIVINYPNGLVIYNYDKYVEQLWLGEQSHEDENRRINTPCGSVIVFYKNCDFVLVMRYNGEVYRIYTTDVDIKNDEKESDDSSTCSPRSLDSEHLMEYCCNEIGYIKQLIATYKIIYFHLTITTAVGFVMHITSQGHVYVDQSLEIAEGFDCYANESYSDREDGVRRIWMERGLRCYHVDGTVITAVMENNQISHPSMGSLSLMSYNEDKDDIEKSYSIYQYDQFLEQHRNYAQVRFLNDFIAWDGKITHIEVNAPGNICTGLENANIESIAESGSVEENEVASPEGQFGITFLSGQDLKLEMTPENVKLSVKSNKCLGFEYVYDGNVEDLFDEIVEQLPNFEKDEDCPTKTQYVLERLDDKQNKQGFLFLEKLPNLSPYTYAADRTFTELIKLKRMKDKFCFDFPWHDIAMEKFEGPDEENTPSESGEDIKNVPMVLTANFYMEIPKNLNHSKILEKFLNPLGTMNYSNIGHFIKKAIVHNWQTNENFKNANAE